MSFEEEWARAKAGALADQQTQMQLAGVDLDGNANRGPAAGGTVSEDLVVYDDELGKLGDMARDLRQKLSTKGDHARQSTFEASSQLSNDGLDMGSALTELHDAWNTKTGTLREACAHISNHLDYSRKSYAGQEEKIVTDMRNLDGQRMTVSRIHEYLK